MNLNQVSLIGRTTRDPELKALPSGTNVCKIGLATNHVYKDKDGKKNESTQFHNLVLFGKTAELAAQYVKKGQEIFVSGRIEYRTWEKKEGGKGNATEIVVDNIQFGSKPGGASRSENRDEEASQEPEEEINPDDIPF